jgi:hypothetical protein
LQPTLFHWYATLHTLWQLLLHTADKEAGTQPPKHAKHNLLHLCLISDLDNSRNLHICAKTPDLQTQSRAELSESTQPLSLIDGTNSRVEGRPDMNMYGSWQYAAISPVVTT